MAVGPILSQIAKLVARQKTTKGLIKNAVKNKLPHTKLKAKEKMLDKSIKRLETQAAEAKTTSKDGQRLATEQKNRKRKISDSSVTMDYSGQTGMGGASKSKRYLIKDKAFNKLTDKAEKLRAEGKIEEANEIYNSSKYKELGSWIADYAGRKAGGPIVKKPMGGKVYKNTVSRKHGGAIGVGSALRGFGKGYKKG